MNRVLASSVAILAGVVLASGGGSETPVAPEPTPVPGDVTGRTLEDSLEQLEAMGLVGDDVKVEPATGAQSDWEVCNQTPEPGVPTSEVRITVSRLCRDGQAIDPTHADESEFVGVVNEHDPDTLGRITVDEALIDLDLVSPIGGSECRTTGKRMTKKALRELRRALPLGASVLVVRAAGSGSAAFVHRDIESKPPKGSSNEVLVATGFWVPDSEVFRIPEKAVLTDRYSPRRGGLTKTERAYAPRIAMAGSDARSSLVGGQEDCHGEATADVAAAEERRYRRWLAEQEEQARNDYYNNSDDSDGWNPPSTPQVPSGEHPCLPGEIDGDGDGICAEE